MADRLTWTSADGVTVIDFTDDAAGFAVLGDGTRGLRSPSYEVAALKFAGYDGEQVQAIRATAGSPTLGVLLQAAGPDDYQARVRALVHAMRPKAGAGTLTASTPVGETRSLTCYCVGGLEGDESTDGSLPGVWWKLALKLYAPDPWWYGDTQTVSVGLGAGQAFFPIFPLVLSPSSVQGQFTVDLSASDAPSFPVWTITGPGSGLVLTNQTTGQSLSLDATLLAGESMTIDSRPGMQSVRKSDGTNLLPTVTAGTDPQLWPLIEGVNTVSAVLTGATSASRVVGQYQPRYAGI